MENDRKYTGGAVVITGASSGIGLTCALRLDEAGYRVFAGVRNKKDGELLARESAGRITPVLLEVTDPASLADAAVSVARVVGDSGLAGLVNNAGLVVGGPLEFLPLSEIRNQLEVNVLGQISVIQAFLPLLRLAQGRIVNMGSLSGRMASPFIGPYAASKYAFEAITDALRIELLPWGISVSIIEPGTVATPIWKKSLAAANAIARQFPAHATGLYGPSLRAVSAAAEKAAAAGIDPSIVARAVLHALRAKHPKTRYPLGRGVRLRMFLKKILPDRLLDRLVISYLGLPDAAVSKKGQA